MTPQEQHEFRQRVMQSLQTDNTYANIAVRCKTARELMKKTQKQMGAAVGVGAHMISAWERGESYPVGDTGLALLIVIECYEEVAGKK